MQLKNPFVSITQRLNLLVWQPLAAYTASILAVLALLVFRLGSLVPGFSPSEQLSISHARSLAAIFHNPLFAPHEFLQYLSLKTGHFGFIAMRLPSVFIAIVCAALFYYIATRWFNFRVAVISTVLFVTSSWFLHIGRSATPEITMLGLLAPIAFTAWLPRSQQRRPIITLTVGAIILVNSLYIPGFVWFVTAGLYWQRHSLQKLWREAKIPTLLIICGALIALTPLYVTLAGSNILTKSYFGLPPDLLTAVKQLPKNLLLIPYNLILSGPLDPQINLGRLPLLDFFAAIMATIGAYSYATHAKLRRSRLLLACIVLSSILVAFKDSVSITILLPFIYLLVAGGINFMLEQWFMVFPYNPFARNLALVLVFAAIAVTGFFHFNRYYVAWPQASATKETYHFQPQRP